MSEKIILKTHDVLKEYPISMNGLMKLERRGVLLPTKWIHGRRYYSRAVLDDFFCTELTLCESGLVYLIKCEKMYKIGKTTNLPKRFTSLQTASPYPLKLIHTIQCAELRNSERRFHQMFAAKRVRGEWFELSEEDVNYILNIKEL
jgi:hypothetical protein